MKKVYKKVLTASLALTAASLTLSACGTPAKKKDVVLNVDSNLVEGDFFTSQFGPSTDDQHARRLLFATNPVTLNRKGQLAINQGIVKEKEINKTKDAEGNTVVRWTLRDDLKWSDGTKITANDYAFGALLADSPAWAEEGASVNVDDAVVGLTEYVEGKADVIKGLRVIDEHTFEVVIAKDKLPYFYELSYFGVDALPLHELGLGGKVVSSDEGVKFDGDMKKVAHNAKVTQLDSKKPTVTYGPYVLDKSSETELVFKLNEKYVGNFEGLKPEIPTIVMKPNKNTELAVQRLITGEVDLVSGLIDAEQLKDAKKHEDKIALFKYNRAGYGYLGMANEFGPTADVNVRHALAHLTNRNEIINSYLAGNGVATNGDYALSQWMTQDKEAELNEKLNKYNYDIDAANAALDKSAYHFEADGVTPFDKSKASESYLRYNDKKEALEIRHIGTEKNPITEKLKTNFINDSKKVGMKYSVDEVDFPTLLKIRKLTQSNSPEQKYHLSNLALGYATVFDPYLSSYHSRNIGTAANEYRVEDAELDKLIENMRNVEPGNTEKYAEEWLKYQERWNELLPIIPLYANIYHDVYNKEKIGDYTVTPLLTWSASTEYIKAK